jgi:carotenoid 1,2-hydratase
LNVALYGPGVRRWALTERGRGAIALAPDSFTIGPSAMEWRGDRLVIRVAETTAPWPRRVRGEISIYPAALCAHGELLDRRGAHGWHPIAPVARAEVRFEEPHWRWGGSAYFDSNRGEEPLENGFASWSWSRADLGGETAVLYDVAERDGHCHGVALRFDSKGDAVSFEAPPHAALPPSKWGLARATRAPAGVVPRLAESLEDGPFYSRSLLATELLGRRASAMHEPLSLVRFRRGWVKALLPFRMPRAPALR